ncbi:MAG: 30S ribosomal protein S3 [Candidatus Shapirobacteria bacterium]|nr:30S ribosomal protein S3 [Candidatus Shapirobacteria bacterium]
MGQKVNPYAYRLAAGGNWRSSWAVDDKKLYGSRLLEDVKIRRFLRDKLASAGLTVINIERSFNRMKVTLMVTRPGVVIGRGGKNLEVLKNELCQIVSLEQPQKNLEIRIEEVKEPNLSAAFIAQRIAEQLENRMPHRRIMRRELEQVMNSGAEGIKVRLSGRIDGAKIGRVEKYSAGKVPTSTIRADIDYTERPALTRKGYVGVKVWIYKS